MEGRGGGEAQEADPTKKDWLLDFQDGALSHSDEPGRIEGADAEPILLHAAALRKAVQVSLSLDIGLRVRDQLFGT
jgi:hypothetical protein